MAGWITEKRGPVAPSWPKKLGDTQNQVQRMQLLCDAIFNGARLVTMRFLNPRYTRRGRLQHVRDQLLHIYCFAMRLQTVQSSP